MGEIRETAEGTLESDILTLIDNIMDPRASSSQAKRKSDTGGGQSSSTQVKDQHVWNHGITVPDKKSQSGETKDTGTEKASGRKT